MASGEFFLFNQCGGGSVAHPLLDLLFPRQVLHAVRNDGRVCLFSVMLHKTFFFYKIFFLFI